MIPETDEAKQELAGFISQAVDIEFKKKSLGEELRDIKEAARDKWDITFDDFAVITKTVMQTSAAVDKANTLNQAITFTHELNLDDDCCDED